MRSTEFVSLTKSMTEMKSCPTQNMALLLSIDDSTKDYKAKRHDSNLKVSGVVWLAMVW